MTWKVHAFDTYMTAVGHVITLIKVLEMHLLFVNVLLCKRRGACYAKISWGVFNVFKKKKKSWELYDLSSREKKSSIGTGIYI